MQRSESIENQSSLPQALELLGRKGSNQNGLAKLVLALVELLRQVLERQALRRVDDGELSNEEVERLGYAFLQLNRKVKDLSKQFGIPKKELDATFGSLIRTGNDAIDQTSLADLLDHCLKRGVFVGGKIKVTVSDVELAGLDLYALLYPASKKGVRRYK